MKEVVLDTETTGLSVKDGHRIVEIGCIELDELIPTKNIFHFYLNPDDDNSLLIDLHSLFLYLSLLFFIILPIL